MGYRRMTAELLCVLRSRLRTGESGRAIAQALSLDKKTVSHYARRIDALELPENLDYVELLRRLSGLISENKKPTPSQSVLAPYAEEIRSLIAGNKDVHQEPMKAKTAWEVVSRRHNLAESTSYETYKRFVREKGLARPPTPAVPRIETEPGAEVQIDYGKAGMKEIERRRRVINAFCGILSASRLPYISFVLSQDEVSFSGSVADMFAFYGGVTRRINLDNLKSGVLTPDVYDPSLNRTFGELCDYYGALADPARVASPKDKGKIERFIPVAREIFKQFTALYPDATLAELNGYARSWCLDVYGVKKHGTTGIPPRIAFEQDEKPRLKPLPHLPFVPARWTTATVHPDQFIQTQGKYYGMPAAYIGKLVAVRTTPALVTIYWNHEAIRQYPTSNRRRHYLPGDFHAYAQPFEPGSYVAFLVSQASVYGPQAAELIAVILESGGNVAIRCAQGCLSLIRAHRNDPSLSHVLGSAIAHRLRIPDRLRILFDSQTAQYTFPLSDTGKAMARSADYYTGP